MHYVRNCGVLTNSHMGMRRRYFGMRLKISGQLCIYILVMSQEALCAYNIMWDQAEHKKKHTYTYIYKYKYQYIHTYIHTYTSVFLLMFCLVPHDIVSTQGLS